MKTVIAIAISSALMSASAYAHKEGDTIIKGGWANIDANAQYSAYEAEADNGFNDNMSNKGNGFFISATHMVSDNVGLELAYHYGLKADSYYINENVNSWFKNKNTADMSIKGAPITLTANYYFGNGNSKFRPYIGAGLAYTYFSNENYGSSYETTEIVSGITDSGVDDISNAKMDPAIGLAAKIGADYYLTDNFLISASVTYVTSKTTFSHDYKYFDGMETVKRTSSSDIDVNPIIATVGIGYRF